ncbi:uncharacterized protein CDV56_101865 [Aspergillus thermomutatus]|uniref:Uncharacterized protein n=1 Tax=Aspergillus thermomutatus TaxID=41047 RepID=A0A397GBV2_ASPTH|nr:uncharacterized protein CDV56_101865 [Aspergillus thermomutatus]RHZ46896.1 hypothetical protein CDV56_101865 [Aspergillus thermomutatus]
MMEKLEHRSDNSFVNVRITLIVIAIVSFPFNLIGIFIENAQTASINQIVALSSSGLSAIMWLYWHRQHPASLKSTAGMMITDFFFAIYLTVIYLTMIIISGAARKHVVFVYGNLACLVSGLFHAYAALKVAIDRYKAYLARVSRPKSVAFCPRCSRMPDYHIMDGDQEVGVAVLALSPGPINAESEPLMGSDSTTSAECAPFRVSEDTAVSLGSAFTVETFDGSAAAVQTK